MEEAAARSTTVTFINNTNFNLSLSQANLSHGSWGTFPPSSIPAHSRVNWESVSDGVGTGTEGIATYLIGSGDGSVTTQWDNPFVGSNSYKCYTSSGYSISYSGGSGDNANVTFTLSQ